MIQNVHIVATVNQRLVTFEGRINCNVLVPRKAHRWGEAAAVNGGRPALAVLTKLQYRKSGMPTEIQ